MSDLQSISVGRRSPSSRTKGFSLMEMIVVIGIIALTLLIVIPTVMGVKAGTQRADCATSLHNIGLGVWTFSLDNRNSLPAYAGGDLTFDTLQMASGDGKWMNLGLVQDYVDTDNSFYCPSQDQTHSPSIAYDSPVNQWKKRGHHRHHDDDHDGDDGGTTGGDTGTTSSGDLNSSYAARPQHCDPNLGPLPGWKTQNYYNRVIYSDFLSVDQWNGQSGRLIGPLLAPHAGRGYNRLFGDGSVRWVGQSPLAACRPITEQPPTVVELDEYYKLLDVLP